MKSNVKTVRASLEDLPVIVRLFEEAIAFQQANGFVGWKQVDTAFLTKDIESGLLFKMDNEGQIICIFCICFSDPLIWRDKEKGDAIYLHRIVLNRRFTGIHVFGMILDWAMHTAMQRGLRYVRMDTWSGNEKLISYYERYGFKRLETFTTPGTDDLPEQHRNLSVTLLEKKLDTDAFFI